MSRPARATHGSYGYGNRKKCQCQPCRDAVNAYQKRLHYDHYNGKSRRIDATETKAHVQALLDAGCTFHQISEATGKAVFEAQIRNLMTGNKIYGKDVTWLHQHTVDALLAVTYQQCMEHDYLLPAELMMRRVRALQYMGHSIPTIAERIGVSDSMGYTWGERSTMVKASTLRKIDAVYAELSMVRGDNERTRWAAFREGYVPPMAWDEDTINDLDAEPDLSAVACVVASCGRHVFEVNLCRNHYYAVGQMRGLEIPRFYKLAVERLGKRGYDRQALLSNLKNLKELGYTPERAAMRLGRSQQYIEKVWSEA